MCADISKASDITHANRQERFDKGGHIYLLYYSAKFSTIHAYNILSGRKYLDINADEWNMVYETNLPSYYGLIPHRLNNICFY